MVAADLVRSPEWWAESWTARALLLSIPGLGKARVARQLVRFGISTTATLGELSRRQREALAGWLIMRAIERDADALIT